MPDGLYDADFFLWTQEQARLLRDSAHAATNLPLDWENLAEEVEDLGRSNRRELRNRLRVVIEHLLKLRHSASTEPRAGWIETLNEQRDSLGDVLADSPSLRGEVAAIAADVFPRAAKRAAQALQRHGEPAEAAPIANGITFSIDQLLSDWLPDSPA